MKALRSIVLGCLLSGLGSMAMASNADDYIRAIKQDNPSRVAALLREGTDPNTRDERGVPMLVMAIQEGSTEAAKAILAAPRLDVEQLTPTDENALMMAALKGNLDIARTLIGRGAKVNKTGWSPLHYAATGGNVDMIRLLIERGALVDARSPNESTPLMMAARYGSFEGVQTLLRAGADPRAQNQLAMDALDFAASAERPDAMELLTEAKRRTPMRPRAPAAAAPAAPATAPAPVASPAPVPAPVPAAVPAAPAPVRQAAPATAPAASPARAGAVTSGESTPITSGEPGSVLRMGSDDPGPSGAAPAVPAAPARAPLPPLPQPAAPVVPAVPAGPPSPGFAPVTGAVPTPGQAVQVDGQAPAAAPAAAPASNPLTLPGQAIQITPPATVPAGRTW